MSDRYAQMFNLRAEEQALFDSLSEDQQRLYLFFRESFVLTQGSQSMVINYVSAFAAFNTKLFDIVDIIPPSYKNPPEYILAIRAPENHVRSGKPEQSDAAVKAIEDGWKSLVFQVADARNGLTNLDNAVMRYLIEFVNRDIELVTGVSIQVGDDGPDIIKKTGRVTVEDRRASFIASLFLNTQYNHLFSAETRQFMEHCQQVLKKYIRFLIIITSKSIKEQKEARILQLAIEYMVTNFDIDEAKLSSDDVWKNEVEIRVDLMTSSYQSYFGVLLELVPDFPVHEMTEDEKRLFRRMEKLVYEWEEKHEGESYFSQTNMLEQEA